MKNCLLLFFLSFSFLFHSKSFAQNFPQRGSDEPPGNFLCGDFIAGSTQAYTPDAAAYFFPCGAVNNSQWFLVSPIGNQLIIELETTNCFGGTGVELAVYDNHRNLVSDCLSAPFPFQKETMVLDNLSPGGAYSIVVDGRSNGICEFELTVRGNSYEPLPSAEILPSHTQACAGSTVCYRAVPTSTNVINYLWTVSPNGRFVGPNFGQEVCIEWLNNGGGQIGMTPVGNGLCGTFGVRKTRTVQVVTPRDTTFLSPLAFCPENFPISETDYCQTPVCAGDISAPGQYCVTLTSSIACDSVVCYQIESIQIPPIVISQKMCAGGKFYFRNTEYAAPGDYTLTLLNYDGTACDTSLMIHLEVENSITLDSLHTDSILCNVSCVPIEVFLNYDTNLVYQWTTGDGVINGSDSVLTPEVCQKGFYNLFVRDTLSGATCSFDVLVPQAVDTSLVVDFTVQNLVCEGDSVTIALNGAAPVGADLNWNLAGFPAGFLSGAGPFTVTFNTPGTYPISLQAEKSGCFSNLQTDTIVVDEKLDAPVISCTTTLNSILFDWQDISGANEYVVSLNGVPQPAQTSSQFLVPNLQPGDAAVIIVQANGQTFCGPSMATQTCSAQNCPPLNIHFPYSDFCENDQPVALNFPQIPANPCAWSGRGVSACQFNPSLAGLGRSFIKYDFTSMGCRYVDSFSVYVEPAPIFSATLQPSLWAPGGRGSIDLTVQTPFSEIIWRKGDGSFFSNREDLTNVQPGEYCATVVGDNGCEKTECYTLLSGIYRVPQFTYICQGQSAALRVRPASGATFSWSPAAGLSCTDCPNPTASPNFTTRYTVTATLPDGQQSSTEVWVIVFIPPFCGNLLSQNLAVDEDLDKENIFENTLLKSGDPLSDSEIMIFPNPTGGQIFVESAVEIEHLEINDLNGKILFRSNAPMKNTALDLSAFGAGTYILRLKTARGSQIRRIVKTN